MLPAPTAASPTPAWCYLVLGPDHRCGAPPEAAAECPEPTIATRGLHPGLSVSTWGTRRLECIVWFESLLDWPSPRRLRISASCPVPGPTILAQLASFSATAAFSALGIASALATMAVRDASRGVVLCGHHCGESYQVNLCNF